MAQTVYKEKGSATVTGDLVELANNSGASLTALPRGGGSNGTIQLAVYQNDALVAKASMKASETDSFAQILTIATPGATPGLVDHGEGATPRMTLTYDLNNAPKFRIASAGSLAWSIASAGRAAFIQGNGFVDFDVDVTAGGS